MDQFTRRRIYLISLLGLSLLLILILAGGIPNLQFRPGKSLNLIDWFLSMLLENQSEIPEIPRIPPKTNFGLDISDTLLNSLIVVFWLMLIFSIATLVVSPKFRREMLRMLGIVIPMVILLPQIAKAMIEQRNQMEEDFAGGLAPADTAFPQPPPFIQDPPDWIFITINLILLAIIIVGIIYLWRRFRPRSDIQAVVVKEVRRALSNLESGSELKDVVIACYAQMCQGLQENQRIKRHRAMTPREFEKHLSDAGIASTHIQQLTRLFEGVRYGAIPTNPATEKEAKYCLQSILEVYGDL